MDTSGSTAHMTDDAPLTETVERRARRREPRPRRWPRVGSVIAIVALLGVVGWYVVDMRRDSSEDNSTAPATPVALSPDAVKTLAEALGQPIYWLGPQDATTYEVLQTPNGNVYVRYLPEGTEVGDPGAFTTVGTYPVRNAYDIIDAKTRKSGASAIPVAGGGVGLATKTSRNNVYVAYPGSDFQIEVFSPVPNQARQFLESGRLAAVGGAIAPGTTTGAAGVSAGRLKALAASLGQPIYWAGTRPKTTYEFTRAGNGSVFVRYLPSGAPVGTSNAYLTVGTYPFKGAFAATSKTAAKSGSVTIPIGGGAIAFYNRKKPTNVYVAYRGSDYQIEVFDPKPGAVRKLVAAESIAPVR